MVQSSEHQRVEGLRCSKLHAKGEFRGFSLLPPPEARQRLEQCPGLLLELDPEQGLGRRCGKKKCRRFHPLPGLLREAVEQGMVTLEAILDALDQPEQHAEETMPQAETVEEAGQEQETQEGLSFVDCQEILNESLYRIKHHLINSQREGIPDKENIKILTKWAERIERFEELLKQLLLTFKPRGVDFVVRNDRESRSHFYISWRVKGTNATRILNIHLDDGRVILVDEERGEGGSISNRNLRLALPPGDISFLWESAFPHYTLTITNADRECRLTIKFDRDRDYAGLVVR